MRPYLQNLNVYVFHLCTKAYKLFFSHFNSVYDEEWQVHFIIFAVIALLDYSFSY